MPLGSVSIALSATAWWARSPNAKSGTPEATVSTNARAMDLMRPDLLWWALRHPGHGQEPDVRRARLAQRARTGLGGGSGGEHVVDQHDAAAGDARALAHRERALHVRAPGGRAQPRLGRRVGAPHQRRGRHLRARAAGDLARQELRLV